MTDLAGRGPIGQKTPKPAKKPRKPIQPRSKKKLAYLRSPDRKAGLLHMAQVARLPCMVCGAWPVEVHHVCSGRYSQAKASDFQTISLCYDHHRGANGIHTNKTLWESTYGLDTDYLPVIDDMLKNK